MRRNEAAHFALELEKSRRRSLQSAAARGDAKPEQDQPMTPDEPENDRVRLLTDAERKAEQKAAKKADKKAARDKANRERQMGARRRK
jgi:hypothetical protein